MPVETEKKFRLDRVQLEAIARRLEASSAEFLYERFEENSLFRGGVLDERKAVLRLRKTETTAFLTYKEAAGFEGGIKERIEFETEITDADAVREIIFRLGCRPSVVYEKRRKAWHILNCEVVLDELPFGFFLEIEGSKDDILKTEKLLGIEDLTVESNTYPSLTAQYGKAVNGVMEARFGDRGL
ncbi:MAG: class IV adenylate cyclase [Acidobacteria bacterium]|nr:class IV adenylate cyclase [Acidobacteriota bacterium]